MEDEFASGPYEGIRGGATRGVHSLGLLKS